MLEVVAYKRLKTIEIIKPSVPNTGGAGRLLEVQL